MTPEKIAEIYEKYGEEMQKVLTLYCPENVERDDAFQQVWVNLLSRNSNEITHLKSYVTTAVKLAGFELARKEKLQRLKKELLQENRQARSEVSASPLDTLLLNEAREVVKKVIEKLPEQTIEAIKMRSVVGQKESTEALNQISKHQNRKRDSVRNSLTKARRKIRKEVRQALAA